MYECIENEMNTQIVDRKLLSLHPMPTTYQPKQAEMIKQQTEVLFYEHLILVDAVWA